MMLDRTPLRFAWKEDSVATGIVRELQRQFCTTGDPALDLVTKAGAKAKRLAEVEGRSPVGVAAPLAKVLKALPSAEHVLLGRVRKAGQSYDTSATVTGLTLRLRPHILQVAADHETVLVPEYLIAVFERPRRRAGFTYSLSQLGALPPSFCGHALFRCAQRGAVKTSEDLRQRVLLAVTMAQLMVIQIGRGDAIPETVAIPDPGGAWIARTRVGVDTSFDQDGFSIALARQFMPVGNDGATLYLDVRTYLSDQQMEPEQRKTVAAVRDAVGGQHEPVSPFVPMQFADRMLRLPIPGLPGCGGRDWIGDLLLA